MPPAKSHIVSRAGFRVLLDIDGWRARELMAPLFMGDDEELQTLIRDHLILPCLFGDFHPSHIQEYAGGLLLALEKPAKDGGGIRPGKVREKNGEGKFEEPRVDAGP